MEKLEIKMGNIIIFFHSPFFIPILEFFHFFVIFKTSKLRGRKPPKFRIILSLSNYEIHLQK